MVTLEDCTRREKLYKRLLEKIKRENLVAYGIFTRQEQAAIELAIARSIAIEEVNIDNINGGGYIPMEAVSSDGV